MLQLATTRPTVKHISHAKKLMGYLKGTINYEGLYAIVKQVMSVPSKLLEHLGQKIIEQIREDYGNHTKVEVSISKHNPPIGGICARSTVMMTEQDLG